MFAVVAPFFPGGLIQSNTFFFCPFFLFGKPQVSSGMPRWREREKKTVFDTPWHVSCLCVCVCVCKTQHLTWGATGTTKLKNFFFLANGSVQKRVSYREAQGFPFFFFLQLRSISFPLSLSFSSSGHNSREKCSRLAKPHLRCSSPPPPPHVQLRCTVELSNVCACVCATTQPRRVQSRDRVAREKRKTFRSAKHCSK